jgi:hypothetical protein
MDASVADQDVKPIELMDREPDRRLGRGLVADIQVPVNRVPPPALMASATASPSFSRRPPTITRAPSAANTSAITWPIPLVAPASRATFPSSLLLPELSCTAKCHPFLYAIPVNYCQG